MTYTQFQQFLHRLYQGDTDTPSSTSSDYTTRGTLLQWAIEGWDAEEGVLWKELWKQLSDASDGTKTTATSTTAYNCPSDMKKPVGGYVRLTNSTGSHTYYPVVTPQKAELFRNETIKMCWFTGSYTGSVGGLKLNFMNAPTASLTINYPYYKIPTIPSASSDVIEMSDPWFAIHMALSKLHELDGEGDRASLALGVASAKLKSMKVNNGVPGWYQDNYVPDRELEVGTDGFGR